MINKINKKQSGQILIITVLVLGGIMVAASTIAGYLTLLKIRQSGDISTSAKAIFAADAGIEWDLYRRKTGDNERPLPVFIDDKASVDVQYEATWTKSIGTYLNTSRALRIWY